MSTKETARQKLGATHRDNADWPETLRRIARVDFGIDALIKLADALQAAGNMQRVDEAYSTWLSHTASPHKFIALFNYGVILGNTGRDAEAIAAYEQAIALNPAFAHPKINLGLALERQGRQEDAIKQWREIIDSEPLKDVAPIEIKTAALNHIGRLKEIMRHYDEAEAALAQSLRLNHEQGDALHHWFHLRQKQCKWPSLIELGQVSKNQALRSMSPLAALAYDDDPAYQMYVADRIVRQKFTFDVPRLSDETPYAHEKIRIGYLSGDLCMHAVGLILPELFELYDKNKFDLYVYDYSREDGTAVRARYRQSTPNFYSIAGIADQQAAALIRSHEIDILVDLHGLSQGVRAEILAYKPAPIQVTYLGYIGTTMLPYIDYVITDEYCFQDSLAPYYSEKPIRLSRCCIPTDRKRQIDATPTRTEVGLPEDQFIFASFNNSYKQNQQTFQTWMQILKRVPESVLWIVDDNPWATKNMKQYASEQGVSEDRLIYTQRVHTPAYLGRMPLADLFLDNYPYNAGSTGSDVLWMGVPMITLSGKTFVSRMAGSMLHHCGLDWLIAQNHSQYEELAVILSGRKDLLAQIKSKLLAQRAPGGAFDMTEFTRNLEQKYLVVYQDFKQSR